MIDGHVSARMVSVEPGDHIQLLPPTGARAVLVIDGVLAMAHPIAALGRALRDELVLFPQNAPQRLENGSRNDHLHALVMNFHRADAPVTRTPAARYFSQDDQAAALCLVVSSDGRDGSWPVPGAPDVYVARLAERDTIIFEPAAGCAAVLLLSGNATADRTALQREEPLRLDNANVVRLSGGSNAHLMLVDVPASGDRASQPAD